MALFAIDFSGADEGLAHLFDVLKCAMLNFALGEESVAHVAVSLQRIQFSPVTSVMGDVVGVLQFEQDNS